MRSSPIPLKRRSRAAQQLASLFLLAVCLGACSATREQPVAKEDDRDAWQKPAEVIALLGIVPGSTIADLGSGSGYFTDRLASATGASGKVFAVDVDPVINAALGQRLEKAGVRNVAIITSEVGDARLPLGSVDLVFVSNTYHHLPEPEAYFKSLTKALRDGARVAILEYRPDATLFVQTFGHGTEPLEIQRQMEAGGYTLVSRQALERQDLLVFRLGGDGPR